MHKHHHPHYHHRHSTAIWFARNLSASWSSSFFGLFSCILAHIQAHTALFPFSYFNTFSPPTFHIMSWCGRVYMLESIGFKYHCLIKADFDQKIDWCVMSLFDSSNATQDLCGCIERSHHCIISSIHFSLSCTLIYEWSFVYVLCVCVCVVTHFRSHQCVFDFSSLVNVFRTRLCQFSRPFILFDYLKNQDRYLCPFKDSKSSYVFDWLIPTLFVWSLFSL